MKQSTLCWILYAGDNNDYLVHNWLSLSTGISSPVFWIQGDVSKLPGATDPNDIRNNLLFSYNTSYEIYKPSPSAAFVFLDECLNTVADGYFATRLSLTWQNSPTTRHTKGATFSFADGHSERWGWRLLSTEQGVNVTVPAGQDVDLKRLQDAVAIP